MIRCAIDNAITSARYQYDSEGALSSTLEVGTRYDLYASDPSGREWPHCVCTDAGENPKLFHAH